MIESKTCTKCSETKPVEEFNIRKYGKNGTGRHFCCKPCQATYSHKSYVKNKVRHAARSRAWRDANPKRAKEVLSKSREKSRFKTSLAKSILDSDRRGHMPCISHADKLSSSFTGRCHVCGMREAEHRTRLHMDHCHKTGAFRGWLCNRCNTSIGHAGDSIDRLLELASYLENAGDRI